MIQEAPHSFKSFIFRKPASLRTCAAKALILIFVRIAWFRTAAAFVAVLVSATVVPLARHHRKVVELGMSTDGEGQDREDGQDENDFHG